MSRFIKVVVVVLGVLLSGALVLPGAAFAHEHREIGDYVFVVGFLNEPAFQGEQNGISVTITRKDTGEPVAGLAETLKAEVIMGAEQREMTLHQAWGDTWGEQGHYTAPFYPTAAGDYTFRFFGEIEGARVDDTFKSGPGRFNGVQAPSSVQFPAVEPTTAEVKAELAGARVVAFAGFTAGLLGLMGSVALLLRSRRTRTVPLRA